MELKEALKMFEEERIDEGVIMDSIKAKIQEIKDNYKFIQQEMKKLDKKKQSEITDMLPNIVLGASKPKNAK